MTEAVIRLARNTTASRWGGRVPTCVAGSVLISTSDTVLTSAIGTVLMSASGTVDTSNLTATLGRRTMDGSPVALDCAHCSAEPTLRSYSEPRLTAKH